MRGFKLISTIQILILQLKCMTFIVLSLSCLDNANRPTITFKTFSEIRHLQVVLIGKTYYH